MATDDKQPLTEIEKSRGVQQMLLLGVDPTSVDKATKGKGQAKRINHAMIVVDDAAEDMTIDRLLAIDEFADDKAAVEELTNCQEKDWQNIAKRLRMQKKRKLEYAALRKEIEKRGWTLVDQKPEGYTYRTYVEKDQIDFVAENYQKALADGAVFMPHDYDFERKAYAEMFVPATEDEEDPEEAKRRREKDEIIAQLDLAEKNRSEWVSNRIKSNDPIPNLTKTITKNMLEDYRILDGFGFKEDEPLCRIAKAIGYDNLPHLSRIWATEILNGTCTTQGQYENFRRYFNPVLDFLNDGYDPCNWEKELYNKCAQVKAPENEEM